MKTLQPRRQEIDFLMLARQLRMWRSYHIPDAHALKLLKLWLGFEFMDLMDDFGRIPVPYFNEVRRRLGYKAFMNLLADIRRCLSFYIVGNSEQDITAIFSPVWHRYEEADGMLLSGSVTLKSAQASVVKCDELKVLYNQVIPTGSNATAFSKEENEASQGDELNPENRDRNRLVRRKLIREYFEWVRRQEDAEHRSMVENLLYRICHPRDKQGHLLTDQELTPEQGGLVIVTGVPGTGKTDVLNYLTMSLPQGRNITQTDAIRDMLTSLQDWAHLNKVWVFLVAHPRMLRKEDGSEGFEEVTYYTIAGSANWANVADFIFSLKRCRKNSCDYTEMNVLKVRDQKLCSPGKVYFRRQPCGRYDERSTEQEAMAAGGKQDVQPWPCPMTGLGD